MIKKSTLIKFALLLSISFVSISVYTYTNTPPAAHAGAPGENDCTSCHGGTAVTNGTNWNAISLSGLPSGGYATSTTYNITLSGNSASTSKNGFQITCLNSSNGMAGSFSAGAGSTIVSSSGISYITQSGNTSGSWTFSWTSPSTAVGTVNFYLAFNGSNANSNTIGDIIYTKSFSLNQVAVNLPTAVISPSSTNICLGDTLFLTGSGINNPTTFNWQFLNNTPSTANGQNVFVIYNSLGSKTIRLTTSNSNGSSPVASINVNVIAKPSVTVNSSNNNVICGNDSITLQANTSNDFTYLWTPGNFTTSSIKVADSINYRVKVTNTANGCFANSNFIKPLKAQYPQSNLVFNKDTICKDDSVTFDLTGSGFTAKYFVNDTLVNNQSYFVFKRNKVGNYKITPQITANGCTNVLANKNINIQEQALAPVVLCGNSTASSMQFAWSQVNGSNGYEVSLNNGTNWINANGLNQLSHLISGIQPNLNTTILVRAAASGPCGPGLISSKTCINNGCTPINALFAYKRNVCINALLGYTLTTFEVKNVSNPKFLIQFETDSALSSFSRVTNFSFNAKSGNNNVRVKIKDSVETTCPIVDSTFVIKGNLAPVSPVLSTNKQSNTFCKGEDILLSSTKSNNYNLYSFYQTNPTKKLIEATLENTINLKSKLLSINNSIKVVVFDTATFCSDSSQEITVIENQKPIANFSFEYFKSDSNNVNKNRVIFTNLSSDSTTFKWYFGDLNNSTSLDKNTEFTYNKGGNYSASLVATFANNCNDSLSKVINITNTSLINLVNGVGIKVFPNPAKDYINIETSNGIVINNVSIIDINGKQLFNGNLESLQSFNIHNFIKGIYLLKIKFNEENIIYSKFIKE